VGLGGGWWKLCENCYNIVKNVMSELTGRFLGKFGYMLVFYSVREIGLPACADSPIYICWTMSMSSHLCYFYNLFANVQIIYAVG
jgi:hypothetical protein